MTLLYSKVSLANYWWPGSGLPEYCKELPSPPEDGTGRDGSMDEIVHVIEKEGMYEDYLVKSVSSLDLQVKLSKND